MWKVCGVVVGWWWFVYLAGLFVNLAGSFVVVGWWFVYLGGLFIWLVRLFCSCMVFVCGIAMAVLFVGVDIPLV